jgi:NADPH-dependent glutamate synthase beta subunit-like oxidoreductase
MEIVNSSPTLERVEKYSYPPFSLGEGNKRVVAFGAYSHKCPVYLKRTPPCTAGCPADEDIRGYNNLLRGVEHSKNEWVAAFERLTEKNPFPAIMGKVCPHPCQTACNRQFREESVAINAVEHAIGEYAINHNLKFAQPKQESGKSVAVIGGGPAGLSCAYQLRRLGHSVTIFDSHEKLGGMMRYGILNYRVSRNSLDAEIQRIVEMGVEVRLNVTVGRNLSLEELEKRYDLLFVAVGAQRGKTLPIPGFSEVNGTTTSVDFLGTYEKRGLSLKPGEKVIIVGDGDVAIDSARLVVRLGGSALLLSAVTIDDMACSKDELDDALKEGVKLVTATGAAEVKQETTGELTLKCFSMVKKDESEDGWNAQIPFLRYKEDKNKIVQYSANLLISSIGQVPDLTGLESLSKDNNWLNLDKDRKVIGKDNIFGGGDAEKVGLIVTAVAHGAKAAKEIDHLLTNTPAPKENYQSVVDIKKQDLNYFEREPAKKRQKLVKSEVKDKFDELLVPLTQEEVVAEAGRCMSCGLCFDCNQCLVFCPQDAISRTQKNPIGEVMYTHYTKCIGCHICSYVCPAGYIQMGMSDEL